jgi:hypothetical protein
MIRDRLLCGVLDMASLLRLIFLPALACSSATASAHVIVRVEPMTQVVARGDTFAVELRADFSTPVVGWGLDFNISDAAVAITISPPDIGSTWIGLNAADGDDLAALAFPSPVVGNDVLLATIQLKALHIGQTDLIVTATEGDLTEGFPLPTPGAFDTATLVNGSVIVIPAPASAILFMGVVGRRQRRRCMTHQSC